MSKEAIQHYESALKEAFPSGATGDVFFHWNEARKALSEQPAQQEPVAMRMPKVGDEVVCIEDDSLGTVAYLTAGGSPEITFDDGSHGTYLLREFAELFRYTTPQPPAQPLTDEQITKCWGQVEGTRHGYVAFARAIEAAHGITKGKT